MTRAEGIAGTVWAPHLAPGERLVWEGRPRGMVSDWFYDPRARAIGAAVSMALFLLALTQDFAANPAGQTSETLFAALIASAAFGLGAWGTVRLGRDRRNVYFAITSRRALHLTASYQPRLGWIALDAETEAIVMQPSLLAFRRPGWRKVSNLGNFRFPLAYPAPCGAQNMIVFHGLGPAAPLLKHVRKAREAA